MPSDKPSQRDARQRRPFRNDDEASQPEEDGRLFTSNRWIDPEHPEVRIAGPTDLMMICMEALRGLTIQIKPEFSQPADPAAQVTTCELAVQTERGVETNRLRVDYLRRRRIDR